MPATAHAAAVFETLQEHAEMIVEHGHPHDFEEGSRLGVHGHRHDAPTMTMARRCSGHAVAAADRGLQDSVAARAGSGRSVHARS